jgi:xanthine dehydrogenase accessory factor
VDQLIQAWPEDAFEQIKVTRSTAIAMLTHDPKLDDPALKIALNSSAFYVGALGSKSTHAKRRKRLLNDGMSESQLSRLHAPIGLDIGGTPEEIASSWQRWLMRIESRINCRLRVKRKRFPISNLQFSM